jgi:CelD/BcsL family acetyltransferase involved in cellulose biosynthesis
MEIFARMAELHQGDSQKRGRPGAFASPRFAGFHRKLIEQTFDSGKTLLIEVHAGHEPIGALYSFVHRGRLYFYQSGFRYTADGSLKPGLVSHYLTIQHCLEKPELDEYDFLAGDSRYKRSLATNSRPLRWIVIRRLTLPSLLLQGLRFLKR